MLSIAVNEINKRVETRSSPSIRYRKKGARMCVHQRLHGGRVSYYRERSCGEEGKIAVRNFPAYRLHMGGVRVDILGGKQRHRLQILPLIDQWEDYVECPQPSHLCEGCGPIELVLNAALIVRIICGGGGQIVFQIFTIIVQMRALSIVHESPGRRLVREFYPMRFLCIEHTNNK
jgi:hypothetical protein